MYHSNFISATVRKISTIVINVNAQPGPAATTGMVGAGG